MPIRPVLDTLATTLQRRYAPLASQLSEGLDRDTIAARFSALPVHVAKEVHDYFEWRNGLRIDRDSDHELFPEAIMQSLDETLSDYQMLCGLAATIAAQAAVPASTIWDERWVPLFRHPAGGAYFVTVGADVSVDRAPILSVVQQEASSASIAFDSLTALIATVNECFDSGAYVARHGSLDQDPQRAAAILRVHNPAMVNTASWLPPNS